MSAFEDQPCIGLFGTCGDSTFRQGLFIPEYERLGIPYFNPQVDDWRPELADIEADHLTYDVVQCWPVLSSTYGGGSLAEQGFSIASSLRAPSPLPKLIIPMIEQTLDDRLTDEVARQESLRARKLVAAHMRNIESPFVYPVESLEEMLAVSISLYGAARALVEASRSYNPAMKRFLADREQQRAFAEALASGQLGSDVANRLKR